jgi:uncharacterized protein YndB with AHSA1/START domain
MSEVVVRTRLLPAAPDAVWARLADFAGIATWAPNVGHSSTLTENVAGLGARRRIQSGRLALVETVTGWEPGHRLRYDVDGLPPIVHSASNTWELEPTGTATTVTLTTIVDAGARPPQRLVAKLVGHRMGEAADQMLTGLDACVRIDACGREEDRR